MCCCNQYIEVFFFKVETMKINVIFHFKMTRHHAQWLTSHLVDHGHIGNNCNLHLLLRQVAKAQQMLSSECRDNKELTKQLGHYPGSEAASGSNVGAKTKRSASSRLTPPTAEQQRLEGISSRLTPPTAEQQRLEVISIVKPSYYDTTRNIPSRLPRELAILFIHSPSIVFFKTVGCHVHPVAYDLE